MGSTAHPARACRPPTRLATHPLASSAHPARPNHSPTPRPLTHPPSTRQAPIPELAQLRQGAGVRRHGLHVPAEAAVPLGAAPGAASLDIELTLERGGAFAAGLLFRSYEAEAGEVPCFEGRCMMCLSVEPSRASLADRARAGARSAAAARRRPLVL